MHCCTCIYYLTVLIQWLGKLQECMSHVMCIHSFLKEKLHAVQCYEMPPMYHQLCGVIPGPPEGRVWEREGKYPAQERPGEGRHDSELQQTGGGDGGPDLRPDPWPWQRSPHGRERTPTGILRYSMTFTLKKMRSINCLCKLLYSFCESVLDSNSKYKIGFIKHWIKNVDLYSCEVSFGIVSMTKQCHNYSYTLSWLKILKKNGLLNSLTKYIQCRYISEVLNTISV